MQRSYSQQEAAAGSKPPGGGSGSSGKKKKKKKKKAKNKNMSIIKRLLRISVSVSLVWLMLAAVNIKVWLYFRRHGNVTELQGLLFLRLVLLRCVRRG